jgi:hypothetical protein
VEKVEAYLSIDGKVYGSVGEAEEADERVKVDRVRRDLETFYAAHADDGPYMLCLAKNRKEVVKLMGKYEEVV